MLSLEWLGDRLVRHLSGTNSNNGMVSDDTVSDKAMSTNQAVTGEDLGSGGSGSHQGRDTEESLKDHEYRNCWDH